MGTLFQNNCGHTFPFATRSVAADDIDFKRCFMPYCKTLYHIIVSFSTPARRTLLILNYRGQGGLSQNFEQSYCPPTAIANPSTIANIIVSQQLSLR